jgi:hypothetical protein
MRCEVKNKVSLDFLQNGQDVNKTAFNWYIERAVVLTKKQ